MKNHTFTGILVAILLFFSSAVSAQEVIISEFMAVNSKTLTDEDNHFSDWLEIYNASDEAIDLNGWFLTDKAENPTKWKFPAMTLQQGAYLVVFASEKNRKNPAANLHTNFKLSGSGEYLAVVRPDTTVSHAYTPAFPSQQSDVSYGIFHGQQVYFTTPTPGAENMGGNLPFAPNFSMRRGFYQEPIDVVLSNPGINGQIYYTLDGTRPSLTTGTVYQQAVRVSTTTPLSACVIAPDGTSSEIITHTYYFIADILKQPKIPTGYPADWKQALATVSIPADYEMDPDICSSPTYKDLMEKSLKSLPSVNIVTNPSYIFSNVNDVNEGGIYIYTGKPSAVGSTWVRPTSIEYYDPATQKEFQVNCQLKLHGGNSRNPSNSPKHSFSVSFKSAYGPSKLNFNLFEEPTAVNEFNSLVFRAGYNNTWSKNSEAERLVCQFVQDSWAKVAKRDLGQVSAHEKFVHLYINGLYWGMYNISEKLTDDFMASYHKGKEADFDIIKEKQVIEAGTITAWNSLLSQIKNVSGNANYQKIQGRNPDGSINASFLNLLNVENYIDYMLVNYFAGNLDWNTNNWVVARNNKTNLEGFRFYCWDTEKSMTTLNDNSVSAKADDNNPTAFIKYLNQNSDFKVKFADRVQKQFLTPGGAFTPEKAAERFTALTDEIDLAVISESARWGDYWSPAVPLTRNDNWLPRNEWMKTQYFPNRTDVVVNQLKSTGYLPAVDAPVFTHTGGSIAQAIELGMTTNEGTIYYTTDGTDPRVSITSAIASTASAYANPVTVSSDITVRARAKTTSEWSAITEATFSYNGISNLTSVALQKLDADNFPNPFNVSTQIYFTLPANGRVSVDIIGMDGRLVQQLYNGTAYEGPQKIEWTPGNIQMGVYICKINYEGQNTYLKIIKQ